jgi:ribonucleoside-diphosphate reductase alpha chain
MRSRPATRINKTTSGSSSSTTPTAPTGGGEPAPAPKTEAPKKTYSDEEAIACSLENPEACEACQ